MLADYVQLVPRAVALRQNVAAIKEQVKLLTLNPNASDLARVDQQINAVLQELDQIKQQLAVAFTKTLYERGFRPR